MTRSPLFYVGDKYKLVPQLIKIFPDNISNYVEPFYGGGSSQLSVNAERFYLNDINDYVIKLHLFLLEYSTKRDDFFSRVFELIDYYKLSCSFKNKIVPTELKKKYPKTYYSKFNKEGYEKLKTDYNFEKCSDMFKLYLLLIYGFNHMMRFNSNNEFNLPVGNVDFNKNVFKALNDYFDLQINRSIKLCNCDFESFINSIKFDENTFVYFDPPYLISMSEYNKNWTEEEEKRLYALIDKLNDKGVKFGITNLIQHKGKINNIFKEWSENYKVLDITSNYISFNDNTIKQNSKEIYVYNY